MYILTPYSPLAYPSPSHDERVRCYISDGHKPFDHSLTPSGNLLNQSHTSGGADSISPLVSEYHT